MKDGKVYQGDDTDIDFPVARYVDGSPIDLTGATLYCEVQFGTDTPIVAGATFINADGTSRARFSSSQTALWVKDKQGKFDGRVKLANGLKHTVGTGEFWVKDPITTVP